MGSGHVHAAPLAPSVLGRLDARARILAVLPAIVLVNALPMSWWPVMLAAAAIFLGMVLACGHGAGTVLRRGILLLPFVLFVVCSLPFSAPGAEVFSLDLCLVRLEATDRGLALALEAGVRAGTSILGILFLTGTTEPPQLFSGLASLGLPSAFVVVLSMVYRYLFLLGSEAARVRRAAAARGFSPRNAAALPRLGAIAGSLLVRSAVRSERVHRAMLARSFRGRLAVLARTGFGLHEALFLLLFYLGLGLAGAVAWYA